MSMMVVYAACDGEWCGMGDVCIVSGWLCVYCEWCVIVPFTVIIMRLAVGSTSNPTHSWVGLSKVMGYSAQCYGVKFSCKT